MSETAYKRPHQRIVSQPAVRRPVRAVETPAPAPPAQTAVQKRKKSWPILEIVLILLLVKVLAGAVYVLLSGEGEQSDPFFPAITQAEAASALPPAAVSPLAAGAALSLMPASAAAAAPAPVAFSLPAPLPPAAALAVPAAATAASLSVNAMAGGAALVVSGAQGWSGDGFNNAYVPAAESIPLPPDSADLRRPTRPGNAGFAGRPVTASPPASAPVRAENYQREQDLARREAELEAREQALTELESELERKLSSIESTKTETEAVAARNQEILAEQKALREQQAQDDQLLKDARIEHLVTAYKSMKPEQAGLLINSMDDAIAVAILSAMPGRNAGLILATVDPEKAARLTKAISEKRVDPKLLLEESGNTPPADQQL